MPLVPEAGGTERITSLVAKGLSARGHNCMSILVFDEKGTMTYEGTPVTDLYAFLKENHVDVVINQIAYAKWLLSEFLTQGGDRWHAEGGRIISCLHFDPEPTSDLYFFMSRHEKSLRDYINVAKAFLLAPYYRKRQERRIGEVYNWVYDNSDWYITLSPTHFPYYKRVTGRSEYNRLRAINNPLTFDTIADRSVIDRKKKVVLICSRMDEYQKRISLALKAWAKLQNRPAADGWQLKILGVGPDLDEYKKMSSRLRLRNVTFEGRQVPDAYYEEASIFMMTSTGIEGWGLTLTESLQSGVVPVVMNTCTVYGDIITQGYNGYLSEGSDIETFSNYIHTLMQDDALLRSMQANALESAQRFTLARTMTKWDELLNNR